MFLPYVAALKLLAVAKDIIKLQFLTLFFRIKAVLWVIFNMPKILRKRAKLQKMRQVKDKEILKLFSEKYLFRPAPPL